MNYMFPRTASLYLALSALASLNASDWLTFGGNLQRTGWAQGEKDIDTNNAKDLTLLWKASLENEPRELASLTAPVAAEWVVTQSGLAPNAERVLLRLMRSAGFAYNCSAFNAPKPGIGVPPSQRFAVEDRLEPGLFQWRHLSFCAPGQ